MMTLRTMNTTIVEPAEPQLAPPGAGLPLPELWIARALFALRRLTGSRTSFTADFERERAAIHELVRSSDPETGATRVLIERPVGLEDSSRYWSVWMTLDHLRIIHTGCARTVEMLARGEVPGRKASTAAVKPSPEASAAVLPEYEQSCDHLLATFAAVPDLNKTAKYAHPWFGPLTAAGWQALSGSHLRIHRAQIQRILDRLKTEV
jgi:hypothetical protein